MLLLPRSVYINCQDLIIIDFHLPLQIVVDLEYYGLSCSVYFGRSEYNTLQCIVDNNSAEWFKFTHELYRSVGQEHDFITNVSKFCIDGWVVSHTNMWDGVDNEKVR